MKPETGAYRRDIDGLRAVAILAVVVFHTLPGSLPGGFIGVDVFFVISGFLITGILRKQLAAGHFGIGTFYAHRIRRIFPALCTVLLATFLMGWLLAVPEDFQLIGKHMATGAGFVQNFALLQEAGYFDVATETKPLMHLWSLAIEEQFYLLYPPVLWLLWRMRLPAGVAIGVMALASFAANIALVGQSPSEAFFLPHTRLWELLVGGWLACAASPADAPRPRTASLMARLTPQRSATLGALAIGSGLVLIDRASVFPGWLALLPVLGAALLIHAGPEGWFNRHVLSHPVAVWIGLISYPLYLWHWPLLAYLHIGNHSGDGLRVASACLAVALSWLTYRWIETPVRRGRSSGLLLGALLLSLATLGYLGFNTWQRQGLGFRFNNVLGTRLPLSGLPHMAPGCGITQAPSGLEIAECMHDARAPARFALLGDSKAAALAYGLMAASTAEHPWLVIGGNNGHGSPLPVISDLPGWQRHQPLTRMALKALTDNRSLEVVVITAATRSLYQLHGDSNIDDLPDAPRDTEAEAERGLNRVIDALIASGKKVVLTVDNPTLLDPRRCVVREMDAATWSLRTRLQDGPGCAVPLQKHLQLSQRYREMLTRVRDRHPQAIRIFDPTPLLCDVQAGRCGHTLGPTLLYSYTDHISAQASQQIAQALVPFVIGFAGIQ